MQLCIGEDGDAVPVTAFVEGGGEVDISSVRQTLSKQTKFSTCVLAVATGSTTGTAPALPAFSDSLFEDRLGNNDDGLRALEKLALEYAQVNPLIWMPRLLFGSALSMLAPSSFHLRCVVFFASPLVSTCKPLFGIVLLRSSSRNLYILTRNFQMHSLGGIGH